QYKRKNRSHSKVAVFEYAKFDNGVFTGQFPPDKQVDAETAHHGEKQNHAAAEPIFFLSALQNQLQGSDGTGKKNNTPPVNLIGGLTFAVPGAFNVPERQHSGNNAHRNVDIKNIRPTEVFHDVAAQGRPQCGADNDSEPVNSLCHTSLFDRVDLRDDRLGSNQKSAASYTLQKAEQDELPHGG